MWPTCVGWDNLDTDMLFASLSFLLFFPIVTLGYFLLPQAFRWVWLLGASCLFYMAFIPKYILILFVTILIDYIAAILIEKSEGRQKKVYVIVSVISTCMVLFAFKYVHFFNSNAAELARFFHLNYPIGIIQMILPIGLSFHTFQSLSYVIEVYRGKQKAERHFGIYALYVMFYPQLVAGPIERPQNLLHQFREKHRVDYQRVTDGLKLMAWGFFKKLVIADRVAVLVNHVYNAPQGFGGLALILATVFFAVQIYCDFSGYSDIAIGAAQVMGFKLMLNFKSPYASKSIAEFWKRWHISLSTWFRDYVYLPLGGNRVSKWRWPLNVMVVFVISGFWHGANWTYVTWGALNGGYLIFSLWTKPIRDKVVAFTKIGRLPTLHTSIQVSTTFALICFAWIFFRAKTIGDACYIVTHLGTNLFTPSTYGPQIRALLEIPHFLKSGLIISIVGIVCMESVQWFQRQQPIRNSVAKYPFLFRWFLYSVLVWSILCFGSFGGKSDFIYFQF